jgi:hypothetical protein
MKHKVSDLVASGSMKNKRIILGYIIEKESGDVMGDGGLSVFYRIEWSNGIKSSYLEQTVDEMKKLLSKYMCSDG